MDTNQPPLIRIYQSCQLLTSIKRKLFSTLRIDTLPHSPHNEEKRNISSKIYLYVKKVTKEIINQLTELSIDHIGENHMEVVNKVVDNLR